MTLTPEEQSIVLAAQQRGLISKNRAPSYLEPDLCIVLSIILSPVTLGFSLLFVPILWVIQHDLTASQLATLRREIQCGTERPVNNISSLDA